MSPESDDIFFAHLAAGFGARRSAALAGFSTTALYNRRTRDTAFAERWEAAREQGLARNDMLLIDSVQHALDPGAIEAADDAPRPTVGEAIQIMRLYRRGEGGASRGGGGGAASRTTWARVRSLEEVRESILTKFSAIDRHRGRQRRAEGWVQDESGHWIPPGWERRGEAGAPPGEPPRDPPPP